MRRFSFCAGRVVLGCVLALLACAASAIAADDPPPIDDEAMIRAKREGLTPDQAAYTYFYPEWIDNYFAGMDAIAVLKPAQPRGNGPVDQFATPVYQLMDKQMPGPVEKIDPIRLGAPSVRIDKSRPDREYCQHKGPQVCEVLGRNTWMMWTGGNEGFWDWLGRQFGILDFVRLLDARESSDPNAPKQDRENRFARAGLINEPGMGPALDEPANVIWKELGLKFDEPLDPEIRKWRRDYVRMALHLDGSSDAEDKGRPLPGWKANYPNGRNWDPRIPPPEIYGLSSGVVGLRLFPNPNFDEKARKRWLEVKDSYPNGAGDPALVRPFRVGMSCAFCHVSFHPLNPPSDKANPRWENISGNIGAQYLRVSGVFGHLLPKDNFIWHVLESQPPGTVDTSLVASDNINNPNTMNSVFNLAQRVLVSLRNPKEVLDEASKGVPSVWADVQAKPGPYADSPPLESLQKLIMDYWSASYANGGLPPEADLKKAVDAEIAAMNDKTRRVPRILLDGADSIGAWGALARVYLNIGTNYEQWNTLHDPIVGLSKQSPFKIAQTKAHSVYWLATDLRVGPLRDYFLKASPAMPLLAAVQPADGTPATPDSISKLVDVSKLALGRKVFAENCIACHSSIQPPQRHEQMARDTGQDGKSPRAEFYDHDPGRWMTGPEHRDYQDWARAAVEKREFWSANYLSTDYRIPITSLKTNSCRAMATNGLTGNMWEDFASRSYRQLPSVGDIRIFNPYSDAPVDGEQTNDRYAPKHNVRSPDAPSGGGGPGYYRVPTLASLWATGPYLHNNSLGKFTNDPSISGRLESFNDGIRKLLWKEKRSETSSYGVPPERLKADHGLIWRTDQDSYVTFPGIYLPEILGGRSREFRAFLDRYPELRSIPPSDRPLPTVALLLVAFGLLWAARGPWLRSAGYLSIVLAVGVGLVIYFLNGALGTLKLGPIPAGTPVALVANINPDTDPAVLRKTLATLRDAFTEIESTHPGDEKREKIMRTKVAPALMAINKCPDFVMDRGHYFPWFDNIKDEEKMALIELLKTF